MNQFRLKEIYIDGAPSESHLIQKEVTYMLSRKEVFEVHLNKKGRISFLYETQDGMEQYKIKLSMPEKNELSVVCVGWLFLCAHEYAKLADKANLFPFFKKYIFLQRKKAKDVFS